VRGLALILRTLVIAPQRAHAAKAIDGAAMPWPYALPFAGLLLSIALGPLLFPKIWHHHYGKIAAAWSILTLASVVGRRGAAPVFATLLPIAPVLSLH
jgi:hypothetical protein